LCVSYKPNIAFMKRMGSKDGCRCKDNNYINENYPEIFTIADAKRGIGNTSSMFLKLLKI
jgi:orotidine-5'-phosphate decarboxylase